MTLRKSCASLLAFAWLGCSNEGGTADQEHAAIDLRGMSVAAIAAARGVPFGQVDSTAIEISQEMSRAVPDLEFVRIVYAPRGSAHMATVLHAMRRDSVIRLIRSDSDASAFLRDWSIPDSLAAVTLCIELAEHLGAGAGATVPPTAFLGRESWVPLGFPSQGPPWRSRVDSPAATFSSGHWVASAWMVESGRLARYECSFHGGVEFVAIDSILDVGRPPDKP